MLLAEAYERAIADAVRLCGRRAGIVHVVGGCGRNELLCQLTADACGLPVIAGPVEATALGNVLVQPALRATMKPLTRAPGDHHPEDGKRAFATFAGNQRGNNTRDEHEHRGRPITEQERGHRDRHRRLEKDMHEGRHDLLPPPVGRKDISRQSQKERVQSGGNRTCATGPLGWFTGPDWRAAGHERQWRA
jgi:hypothetical protein